MRVSTGEMGSGVCTGEMGRVGVYWGDGEGGCVLGRWGGWVCTGEMGRVGVYWGDGEGGCVLGRWGVQEREMEIRQME